jgi:hypothetical protein
MAKINSSILTKVRITNVERHTLDVLVGHHPDLPGLQLFHLDSLGCPQGGGHEPAPILNVTNVSQLRSLVHIFFDQVCPTPALGTRHGSVSVIMLKE